MFEEEADRYNDVMSDVATGEQRGGEVRRSRGNQERDISKRLELLARQFATSSRQCISEK